MLGRIIWIFGLFIVLKKVGFDISFFFCGFGRLYLCSIWINVRFNVYSVFNYFFIFSNDLF